MRKMLFLIEKDLPDEATPGARFELFFLLFYTLFKDSAPTAGFKGYFKKPGVPEWLIVREKIICSSCGFCMVIMPG